MQSRCPLLFHAMRQSSEKVTIQDTRLQDTRLEIFHKTQDGALGIVSLCVSKNLMSQQNCNTTCNGALNTFLSISGIYNFA